MKRILIGLALMAMAWPGISGAQGSGQKQQPGDKLGVGDAVRVTVFQQPDLTTDARISEKGTLNVPLIGEVKLAGLNKAEAGAPNTHELKKSKSQNRTR